MTTSRIRLKNQTTFSSSVWLSSVAASSSAVFQSARTCADDRVKRIKAALGGARPTLRLATRLDATVVANLSKVISR